MKCFVENIVADCDVRTDVKILIPEAGLRRRMSRIVKQAVATAVECLKGVDNIENIDAIITATGFGCLEDSEKFLRNIIEEKEQLLNPTPFIQSTFNTVGGQIALLRHNHCYNMTYANRNHSFEDALLDAMMRIDDGDSENVLLGAFDERTESQYRIMRRMGAFRKADCGEGCVFVHLTRERTSESRAEIAQIDFPENSLTEEECIKLYSTTSKTIFICVDPSEYGVYPTSSSKAFADAVARIKSGAEEVIVYNGAEESRPVITVIRCIV